MRLHRATSVVLALTVSTAGAAALAVPASASRPRAPVAFETADPAKVAELMAQGFSEGEALFIALTKVEGKAIGNDRVRLTDKFPTGNQAVIDIRVVPKSAGNPDALKLKTGPSGHDFKFSLEYFVSYDAIPVEARPVALADPSTAPAAMSVSFPASVPAGGDPNGVQVIVKGLVDQLRGDKSDAFLKEMDKKLKTPKLDRLNNKLKAASLANDLLAMGLDLQELLDELKALEDCAKHPTKKLTRKAYKENPGDQQRLLDEIAGVRSELQGNTAAGVIGTINSAASGLIQGAPGWLGYVIGPGTSWALENFKQVAQDRMNEIRKGVVPCQYDLKIDGTAGTPPAHVTALKCGGPVGTWDVAYEQPAAQSSGHISVTIAKDGSGQWQATGTAGGKATGNGGTVTLKMSADGKSGTLTFSLLGSVAVTGGEFCAKGAPGG